MDESLLTGESDLVPKQAGDLLYSGSFCVAGSATYEAQKVGAESFANRLTAGARAFRRVQTPLQQEIDLVIRIIILMAVYFELLLVIDSAMHQVPLVESVKASVVIAGLVPNGLFLAIAVAYAIGAVRMAGKGALVQQANAVESLSNVDVLCLDKTGTLTANRLQFHALQPVEVTPEELRGALGDFVASASSPNRTSDAIRAACPGRELPVVDEVPFSSERKWSARSFAGPERSGTYVLGAPEMLQPAVRPEADPATGAPEPSARAQALETLEAQGARWTEQGLRVLWFAYHPDVDALRADGTGQQAQNTPRLPSGLVPLGAICLSDELRPDAAGDAGRLRLCRRPPQDHFGRQSTNRGRTGSPGRPGA